MAVLCPKCGICIRSGEIVRACVRAEFMRESCDGHILNVYDEEWVEHMVCEPESAWIRFRKWVRRRLRI
jgi:hypothetical protein